MLDVVHRANYSHLPHVELDSTGTFGGDDLLKYCLLATRQNPYCVQSGSCRQTDTKTGSCRDSHTLSTAYTLDGGVARRLQLQVAC